MSFYVVLQNFKLYSTFWSPKIKLIISNFATCLRPNFGTIFRGSREVFEVKKVWDEFPGHFPVSKNCQFVFYGS